MIAIAEVKACEELGVTALVDQFGDERKGVSILDCNLVESSVAELSPGRPKAGVRVRVRVGRPNFERHIFDI